MGRAHRSAGHPAQPRRTGARRRNADDSRGAAAGGAGHSGTARRCDRCHCLRRDGDGDRELVRFAPRTASPGLAAVEVYSFTAEGVPSAVLTKPLLRGTSVDERLDDRATLGIDANGMTPVHLTGDYTAFLVARVAGIPSVAGGHLRQQPQPARSVLSDGLGRRTLGVVPRSAAGARFAAVRPADPGGRPRRRWDR